MIERLPPLVALCGPIGSGKSTVARHLVERHGYVRLPFAGPLKGMLRTLGLGDRELDGDLKETPHPALNGRTPRLAMQTLGTEWGRAHLGQSFWADCWHRQAAAAIEGGAKVVVDDMRFPEEWSAVRSLCGLGLRITRPGAGGGTHVSEQGYDQFEGVIDLANEGDVGELLATALVALNWRGSTL